jgi:hypothetical protein
MSRPSETVAADHQHMVLRATLQFAVPMHMIELQRLPVDMLPGIASASATTVGFHGDALQYGGKHCAEAFNALARGLAAAALTADGGVDFAGLHWCTIRNCRARRRFDHADDTPERPDPEPAPPRPIVDVHLPDYDAV